ncbi:MAG: hypothetical protein K8S16_08285, partial [Bacteroidales bacterium]|nr:hypothetical protein [Bacteroidales bacterium]
MKKLTLLSLSLAMAVVGYAQNRVKISEELKNFAVKRDLPGTETKKLTNKTSPSFPAYWPPEEVTIGHTWYDLQTNASMQNRIFYYDDGTIGAVWTMGFNPSTGFADRGTGYNYFDGTDWGPIPAQRIESERTGWPAYAPWGENGEMIVSHIAGGTDEGLIFMKREDKGVADWNQFQFYVPQNNNYEQLLFPRITTGGIDHSIVHLIVLGVPYPFSWWPQELLYSRSTDGGGNWNPENIILPGIGGWQDEYYIEGDSYEIIADEQSVAILVGSEW